MPWLDYFGQLKLKCVVAAQAVELPTETHPKHGQRKRRVGGCKQSRIRVP